MTYKWVYIDGLFRFRWNDIGYELDAFKNLNYFKNVDIQTNIGKANYGYFDEVVEVYHAWVVVRKGPDVTRYDFFRYRQPPGKSWPRHNYIKQHTDYLNGTSVSYEIINYISHDSI